MRAYDHQNMWSWKNLNIKASRHWLMWSPKHVSMWACDHQSKCKYEHAINKALEHTSIWSLEQTRMWLWEHTSTQVHITLICQSFQHTTQSLKYLSARMLDNTITYASKTIDISESSCVYSCVDIKHVNIDACEHVIIKAFASNHMRMTTYR